MNFVFDVVVRSTAILVVAALLAVMLRRASAAVRHGIWAAAIVSAMLLPLTMRTLPGISVPVEFPMAYAGPTITLPPAENINPTDSLAWRSSLEEQTLTSRLLAAATVAWLAGALLVLSRFALGTRAVRRICRDAGDGGLRPQITGLKEVLGIRRPVRVAVSRQPISPMAWGVLRPVVILPLALSDWPAPRQRAVLGHELAHIKRADGILQILAHVFCSLYWFHPLAWFAVHRMRIEREHACDDQVLRLGLHPEDYAADLLEVARSLREPVFAVGVSMAERSQLETRMVAILNPNLKRNRLSRFATVGLCATVAATLILALIQPARTAPVASAVLTTQVAGGLTPPRLVGVIVQPAYTAEAFEGFIEGAVNLEATIDAVGNVSHLRVVKGLGYGLDESALTEVAGWKFTPALRNGSPVQTNLNLEVKFELAKAGIPLASGIDPPVIVSRVEPAVTEAAREVRARGTVILEVLVHIDGSVEIVRAIQSLGYGLTESAAQALRQWTFEPAKKDGQRIPIRMNVSIVFDWR